jgi:putative membrane protein
MTSPHMTSKGAQRTLFAIVCLGGVAAAVSGCATGTYTQHGRDSAQGPRQTGQQELAASRDPSSEAYVGNVPPSLQTNSQATPGSSYTYGTASSTVVMPASTVVAPAATTTATSTVLVPATTTTVLVPAGGASTTGGTTVLVPATSVPASVVVASDVDFMNSAAEFNATEIQLSQIAAQRAQSPEVRNFALETITTHRRLAGELDGMLRNRSVAVPFSPSPAGNAAVSRLAGLTGWDVDRYYLDQVIADHQAASAMYGAESNQAVDVTVRSTAGGDAVTVRNRLSRATDLRTQID